MNEGIIPSPSSPVTAVATARYVVLKLASAVTGYTVKAIQRKIECGSWAQGAVWIRAPDGRVLIDLVGYQAWVRGRTMPRDSFTKDAKALNRTQCDVVRQGILDRPRLKRTPIEQNLEHARQAPAAIRRWIAEGNFVFNEEASESCYKSAAPANHPGAQKTCNEVFDQFLAHCAMRVSMDDMAFSTLEGYREILDKVFRPTLGPKPFGSIVYSQLADILSKQTRKKKTYNNIASAVRTAFKFGYRDRPGQFNPALALPTFRIYKKDRPPVDPFSIEEAEKIIAASHATFGSLHGNYEEFRFFTGLRQSEQFALEVDDCDLARGSIRITKAVVRSRMKNRTKTNEDREIDLCPRALKVLRHQLVLRQQLVAKGVIQHECVFFTDGGKPFRTVVLPYNRWRRVLKKLAVRYRKALNSRHSLISWRLMVGDNSLLVAQEAGHSLSTQQRNYGAWIKNTTPKDIELIRAAMAGRRSSEDCDAGGPDRL